MSEVFNLVFRGFVLFFVLAFIYYLGKAIVDEIKEKIKTKKPKEIKNVDDEIKKNEGGIKENGKQ